MKRLADMRAAKTISDLPLGHTNLYNENNKDICEYTIDENLKIIFVPNHLSAPKDSKGLIDWEGVTRVQILKLICNKEVI